MPKNLCVYCSSSDRLDQKYYTTAGEVGSEMARQQWTLVYGGGKTGSMGAVARGVKSGGGRVIGVIPEFMKARELEFTEADELISVLTMRERKMLMETRADAFLALPGGWGTLEELLEILTLAHLEVLRKPLVILTRMATTMTCSGSARKSSRRNSCTRRFTASSRLPAPLRKFFR